MHKYIYTFLLNYLIGYSKSEGVRMTEGGSSCFSVVHLQCVLLCHVCAYVFSNVHLQTFCTGFMTSFHKNVNIWVVG